LSAITFSKNIFSHPALCENWMSASSFFIALPESIDSRAS
jgi:hypothetical protein